MTTEIYIDGVLQSIDTQLALLLQTQVQTLPLDRGMGLDLDFVDKPPLLARALYTATVADTIANYMPEIALKEVQWTTDREGNTTAKVVITSG